MGESQRRREHPRVRPAVGQRVEIHIMGDGFLEVLPARDISVGGVAVLVPHDFLGCNIDQPVNLVIKIAGEKAFSAKGVIRHLSKSSQAHNHFFGVQFTSIGAAHVDQIRKYVERRLAEGGEA